VCPFCSHKGHSIIEEKNPILAYLVVTIFIFLIGWFGLFLSPMFMGILRQHIHRCPECLNAIKENSIFSALEDNVRVMHLIF